MHDTRIQRILVFSIIIGALLSAASLFFFEGRHTGGVLSGVVVGTVNFYLWVMIVRKLIDDEAQKASLILRFLLKFGLLGLMVACAIFMLRVSPLGFAVGFSSFIIAIPFGATGGEGDDHS